MNNQNNELTQTLNSFMKDNYTESDKQDLTLWIDGVIKTEQDNLCLNTKEVNY